MVLNRQLMTNLKNVALAASLMTIANGAWASGPMFFSKTDIPQKQGSLAGRYLYVGDVPRFAAEDLELNVSKIGLTLRVKGWVPQSMREGYADILLRRWKGYYDAFQDPNLSFNSLKDPKAVIAASSSRSNQAWLKIAAQYMPHVLENQRATIYGRTQSPNAYKDSVMTALLRFYMGDQTLTLQQGLAMAQSPIDKSVSARLFDRHMGGNFTADSERGSSYPGYLTFVYPIAATTNGPFSIPNEGIRRFGEGDSTMESRAWSNKWQDEFGGMPFLLIDDDGVAFHGPISDNTTNDMWYLRRDYVSHGCHRMDSSDILELRELMPPELKKLRIEHRGVKTTIKEFPDVTSFGGGQPTAVDVAYYDIPSEIGTTKNKSIEATIAPYMVNSTALPAPKKRFWMNHYKPFDHHLGAGQYFDMASGMFHGIPNYVELPGKDGLPVLSRDGTLDNIPVKTFAYRNNRIIQYREAGATLNDLEDHAGNYPPGYFTTRF